MRSEGPPGHKESRSRKGSPRIGVFDSGVGGVTVLAALRTRFPEMNFVYFGDTAHVPYGSKSPSQIQALASSAARKISGHGLDALVVACNTASCWALECFSQEMGVIPVYGMVEFGAEAVREELDKKTHASFEALNPVVIFGTQATVKSGVYARALQDRVLVEERACPLLVPLIEEGWMEHPALDAVLEEYLGPVRLRGESGVALLACTHYPWIRSKFERLLPGWIVIDSAESLVRRFEKGGFSRSSEELTGAMLETGALLKAEDPVTSSAMSSQAVAGDVIASGAVAGNIEWFFSDPTVVPAFLLDFAQKMQGGRVELRSF